MNPVSPLLLANDILYGTTFNGGTGTQCGGDGGSCGTVFKVSTDGGGYEVLWEFPNNGGDSSNCRGHPCPAAPQGELAFYRGDIYGSSYDGGKKSCTDDVHYLGCGTVWKLTP
jgi:uncharacterized repeat protein (TIGR03803 family)